MQKIDFSIERKLPHSAVFFLMMSSAKQIIKQLWAIGAVFLFQALNKDDSLTIYLRLLWIIGVVFVLSVVYGVLEYFYFSYVIADDKLVVKKGVLKKSAVSIPLSRIQNVSVKQGFWQQILEITTLSVDTAGSSENEMEIYLDLNTSNALKAYLEQHKAGAEKTKTSDKATEKNHTSEDKKSLQNYTYTIRKLLIAAISRNHLKGFLVIGSAIIFVLSQIDDDILRKGLEVLQGMVLPFFSEYHSTTSWILMALNVLLLVVLFNIISTILKYYRLKVQLRNDSIRFEAGLINRVEQMIHLDKIQIVKKSTNLLEKLFGVSTLTLLQFFSSSKKEQNNKLTFSLPGFNHTDELTHIIYPNLASEAPRVIYPTKRFVLKNFYLYGVVPSVAALGLLFISWKLSFVTLVWLAFGGGLAKLRYKKSKTEVGQQFLRVSSGIVSDVQETMKITNIQSVTFRQSIFQMRHGIASVVITTRWQRITIPYISEPDARSLCNYLMYKIEVENTVKTEQKIDN